jgi:hypothetical protein
MRTTVSLPDPLLENAKEYAAQRGISLSVLVEDALRSHLARSSPSEPRPFRLHTVRGKLVNPDLDLDRTSGLITLDDETNFSKREQ